MANVTAQDRKGRPIKRVHAEGYALLLEAANSGKTVKAILPQLEDLWSKSVGEIPYLTAFWNGKRMPVAIRCAYFHRMMPLVGERAVEFSRKELSPTGFGTLSKVGNSLYNDRMRRYHLAVRSAQTDLASARELLAKRPSKTTVKAMQDAEAALAECEKIKLVIEEPIGPRLGFDSVEQCIEFLRDQGAHSFGASKSTEVPEHLRYQQ